MELAVDAVGDGLQSLGPEGTGVGGTGHFDNLLQVLKADAARNLPL
jgi:hypothetical protein